MSTPRNQYNTPLVGVVTIHQIRQEADKFVDHDSHYFYRDTDESNGLWVWFHRPEESDDIKTIESAESLSEILDLFLSKTKFGPQIAITIDISDDQNDGPTSICSGDVLRKIGPNCLETRIELISIEGESFGAPRIVRNGPIPDTAAVFIPTFLQEDIDGPITPLFTNVAITDWHEEQGQWHLWEALFKSGNNYVLFQSEIGYDDKVEVMYGEDGIPRELLDMAVSVEFPTDGNDLHPIDRWGRLLIEDIGRQYLPH